MRSFDVKSCPAITSAKGNERRDHWRLFESAGELSDYALTKCTSTGDWNTSGGSWTGGDTSAAACRKAKMGDLAGVARSDALLERFERFAFETERQRWVDDVCGGFPNVPAFLSGHPLAMRRRIADKDGAAPLAVIVDLTTSAGINADTIEKRGAAILALVRLLTMRRPVELWAGVMTGSGIGNRNLAGVFCRLETAPLDLATAAYVMTSAGFPRAVCYPVAMESAGFTSGGWPYNDHNVSRANMTAICAAAFHHASDTLCIPPVHMQDDITKNPEGWIEARLAELAPTQLEAA
jgi:hypothetical protein